MAKSQAQIDGEYAWAEKQRAKYSPGSAGFTNASRVMQSLVQEAAEIRASGSGGGPAVTEKPVDPNAYAKQLEAERRADEEVSAKAFLRVLLTQYNMGSLAGQIETLVKQSTNQDFLAEKVRETNEYKARFKGLVALQGRGNTDVRNEAEYLNLETQYRSAFNEAGLRDYLGTDGSQSEYDSIAELVGDYSVSVEEVRSRIGDAQRVVADTPQEVRDSLQQFYNIDPLTMVEYSLDPSRTQNKINTLANAAIVGGFGEIAGLDLDIKAAESVSGLSNNQDINMNTLNKDLVKGVGVRDATSRLANIDRMELSDSEALLASMESDAKAQKKVKGMQSRERARFGGSSGFNKDSLKNVNTI